MSNFLISEMLKKLKIREAGRIWTRKLCTRPKCSDCSEGLYWFPILKDRNTIIAFHELCRDKKVGSKFKAYVIEDPEDL